VGGFADGSFRPIANRTNPEIGKTAVHEEQCKIAFRRWLSGRIASAAAAS